MLKLVGLFIIYGGAMNLLNSIDEAGGWRFMIGLGMIGLGWWIMALPEADIGPTGQAWG